MDRHEPNPNQPERTGREPHPHATRPPAAAPMQRQARRRLGLGISDAEIVRELSTTSR